MKIDDLIRLIGWTSLTFIWLEVNYSFFGAIANLIHDHNEVIRRKALEEHKEFIRRLTIEVNEMTDDESEDE